MRNISLLGLGHQQLTNVKLCGLPIFITKPITSYLTFDVFYRALRAQLFVYVVLLCITRRKKKFPATFLAWKVVLPSSLLPSDLEKIYF